MNLIKNTIFFLDCLEMPLFEKSSSINTDDISNSLTDNESDDDEWVTVDPMETTPKINGIGILISNEQHNGMKVYS